MGHWSYFVILMVCTLCFTNVYCEDKKPYKPKNPEANEKVKDKTPSAHHEFRSVRVNQVWEKAQRMGKTEKELEKLKADLKRFDEKLYQVKKVERDGGDVTGEQSERMHKQLTEIMQKHEIIPKVKPTKHMPTKDRPFEDKRLNELWKKTLDAKHFNENEVKIMKQQLKLHQDKIYQYQALVDDLYGKGPHPNSVQARNNAVNKEEFQAKELDLKLQHKKLNKDFQMLSVKTMPEDERGGFNEPRIINFWREAMSANFTDEELNSLKEELSHFEGKLLKYDKIQEEAMKAEQSYKKDKMSGKKVDSKKHTILKDKVKDIGSSVKKYFTEIKNKISSRKVQHNEL